MAAKKWKKKFFFLPSKIGLVVALMNGYSFGCGDDQIDLSRQIMYNLKSLHLDLYTHIGYWFLASKPLPLDVY